MAKKIDYKKILNPAQLDAVMTLEGPILVVAGAGRGKTRTLIYRVARLIEKGVPPEAILLLTFTRKAAQEMLDRASGLADEACRFVSGGTFHSLALRVLRNYAALLGFSNSFSILDRSDMEEVLKSLLSDIALPKKADRFPKRGTLASILSKSSNVQRSIEEIMIDEYSQFLQFIPHINSLGLLYGEYKKAHQMMDYDDLILNLQKILAENEEVRISLGRQYSYVMVDEYQDTNLIQADIIKRLAHGHSNIMIVGDDSQSIYSFRGANYRNMFNFPLQFPEAKLIKLEENYRSTQPILSFTNTLMQQASEKFTKCLFSRRTSDELPRIIDTGTEPAQAMFICQYIRDHVQKGQPISDIAVLFRAGYHSFELETALARHGIGYVKYGGFKFLESAHIKDFFAHLRVIVNRDEAVSWIRILRLIKKIGHVRARSIIQWIKEKQVPLDRLDEWPGMANDGGLRSLSGLLSIMSAKKDPKWAVEQVMEYYVPILEKRYDDYPRRKKELEQLIPMAGRYKELSGFLDDLVLEPPSSSADISPENKSDLLTLSTVHSSKGLEWPIVFIIWVMEGRFPPSRALENPVAMEEERRLMYVAATRAKDRLIMCYPGRESLPAWQRGGSGFRNGVSSLIQGIPGDIVSYESKGIQARGCGVVYSDENSAGFQSGNAETSRFSQGAMVRHPAFGPGVVSKYYDDDKVEVFFRNAGRKLLHLEYTTLEKI